MTSINHGGLGQYLTEDGYVVSNISKEGSSNLDSISRIQTYLEQYSFPLPDMIIVFQTEYTRDFKYDKMQSVYGATDWEDISSPDDLSSRWIERFYMRLSEISQKHNIPISIIGGISDTMFFDDINTDYPGCNILCQSFTNLLLNNNSNITTPIYSWYTKNTQDLITKLKPLLSSIGIEKLLNLIDLGFERHLQIKENPLYFFPDGSHPNRYSHYLLYQYLKDQNIFRVPE